MDLNAQRVDLEDWKKNADRFEISMKYGLKPSYTSDIYYATDMSIRTQLLNTYTDNFLQNNNVEERSLISAFLSPSNITAGIGLEYRPKDRPSYFYFSPMALNVKYVQNEFLANEEAFNRQGESLGTIHGNKPGTKSKSTVGAQAKVRFDITNESQTIMWDTYLDVFLAYAEVSNDGNLSPVQAEWVNSLTFRIWRPLVLSIDVRASYDPDLLFIDQEDRTSYSDRESYNMLFRILLSFNTKYFVGK